MHLRPELMPPKFDEAMIQRLAELAGQIDGAVAGQWEDALAEFNRLANTALQFADFQGVYGATEHDTWVRQVLAAPHLKRLGDVSRAGLIEMIRRVIEVDGEEHEITFWLGMLAVNIADPNISDLLYWPGEYFGDGHHSRELSPEEVLDAALSRARPRQD